MNDEIATLRALSYVSRYTASLKQLFVSCIIALEVWRMDNSSYRVIVVEDNEYILRRINDTVDWAGMGMFPPVLCRTAEEAMDKLAATGFDIAIVDIKLPGKTGLELIAWVREKGYDMETMIISAFEEFEFAKKSIDMGVHQYLLKPFSNEEILDALNRLRSVCNAKRSRYGQFLSDVEMFLAACDRERLTETLTRFRGSVDNDLMFCSLIGAPGDTVSDIEKIADWLLMQRYGSVSDTVKSIVRKVSNLIERDYAQELSLSAIARRFNVSPNYLSMMYSREMGEAFTETLLRIRMHKANELLKLGVGASETAARTGYSNYKSFYKAFKGYYGKAPTGK